MQILSWFYLDKIWISNWLWEKCCHSGNLNNLALRKKLQGGYPNDKIFFFFYFKFCHNRWNCFRIIKRPLFGSICQAIMDQRISLPDRGSRGKIARELTMMRFIYHLFNSVYLFYTSFLMNIFYYSIIYRKRSSSFLIQNISMEIQKMISIF